ncbi:hypothetical protein UlMin_031184 [Ulmus minor]
MSSPVEKPLFTKPNSPFEPETQNKNHEEEPDSATGCSCFQVFGFKSSAKERENLLGNCRGTTWLGKKLKKVKEFSEVVAGPKWKNLIRRIGGYCNGKNKHRISGFQYDPQSYALNFDGGNEREEEGLLLGFSSRLTAPCNSQNK